METPAEFYPRNAAVLAIQFNGYNQAAIAAWTNNVFEPRGDVMHADGASYGDAKVADWILRRGPYVYDIVTDVVFHRYYGRFI